MKFSFSPEGFGFLESLMRRLGFLGEQSDGGQQEESEMSQGKHRPEGLFYAAFSTLPLLMQEVQTRMRLAAPFTTARTS